ncbi:MAG: glycosyltransferase 87 family protein [Gallionellaceae bacterium]
MNLLNHKNLDANWRLLLVVMLLGIAWYYWFEWRTFSDFVVSIDFNDLFMQDFVRHYYPMSRQILQVPTPVSGYYYTSFFALLLVPIGALTLPSAMVVWGAIQFTCLAALCIIPARGLLAMRPLRMVLYAGLCTTSYPILNNIKWGQVSILITVCVVAAFFSYKRNKRVLAGILLAFAAAIKFYPAFFIVYFMLKRDARACVAFILAALTFYLVFPATMLGFSNWLEFEKAISTAITNSEWVSRAVDSQYIAHVALRWFVIVSGQNAGDTIAQILTVVGYGIALSCFAMVWFLQRRELCEQHGLPMVMIFLAIPFVIRTSWPHYFVYLPLCQIAVFSYYAASLSNSGLWGKALIALPVLSMVFSSIFLFNLFPNWNIYNSYGMLFLANLLLLVAVYATLLV